MNKAVLHLPFGVHPYVQTSLAGRLRRKQRKDSGTKISSQPLSIYSCGYVGWTLSYLALSRAHHSHLQAAPRSWIYPPSPNVLRHACVSVASDGKFSISLFCFKKERKMGWWPEPWFGSQTGPCLDSNPSTSWFSYYISWASVFSSGNWDPNNYVEAPM